MISTTFRFPTSIIFLAVLLMSLQVFAQTDSSTIPNPSEPASSANTTITQEEDILLDEGVIDAPEQKKAAMSRTDSTAADTTQKKPGEPAPMAADSSRPQPTNQQMAPSATAPQTARAVKPAPATIIENASSINFARSLKEYRSPKIAMLLSLLLPGLGQAYAHDYIKSGVFLAAEVALITGGVIYNVQAGNQKEQAHTFADTAYSTRKLDQFYQDLRTYLANDKQLGADSADSIINNNIFYGYDSATFARAAQSRENDFYSQLYTRVSDRNPYVRGWKDCTPNFGSNGYDVSTSSDSISVTAIYDNQIDVVTRRINGLSTAADIEKYGFSDYAQRYISMVDKSESLYQVSSYFFMGMLLNRLISAVDAGITANAYNNKLLGQHAFIDRIRFDQNIVLNNGQPSFWYAITLKI